MEGGSGSHHAAHPGRGAAWGHHTPTPTRRPPWSWRAGGPAEAVSASRRTPSSSLASRRPSRRPSQALVPNVCVWTLKSSKALACFEENRSPALRLCRPSPLCLLGPPGVGSFACRKHAARASEPADASNFAFVLAWWPAPLLPAGRPAAVRLPCRTRSASLRRRSRRLGLPGS